MMFFYNMFSNIGMKIKRATKVFFLIGMGVSIVCGLLIAVLGLTEGEGELFFIGLVIGVVGAAVSWLSSLFSYGFGELIENSCTQTELLRKMEKQHCE